MNLELDDALLTEARAANPAPENFGSEPLGFPVLKRKPGETISMEQIKAIEEELDEEEFRRALHPRRA